MTGLGQGRNGWAGEGVKWGEAVAEAGRPGPGSVRMDAGDYLEVLRNNLVADGCTVRDHHVGRLPVVVGHRGDHPPQILLQKLHLFTVAGAVEEASGEAMADFTWRAGRYGKARKGALHGLASALAVFTVLVSERVLPEAVACATARAKQEDSVRVRPAVVDLSTGAVHTFQGTQFWGWAMNGHLRRAFARHVTPPV